MIDDRKIALSDFAHHWFGGREFDFWWQEERAGRHEGGRVEIPGGRIARQVQ
jgi:hypothetical protein